MLFCALFRLGTNAKGGYYPGYSLRKPAVVWAVYLELALILVALALWSWLTLIHPNPGFLRVSHRPTVKPSMSQELCCVYCVQNARKTQQVTGVK